ncbi:hypothetical protein NX059_005803 [Plenodomus lindquistii]|nr:hypothetical protein NX059_005803 [Plenodomus lindquistii]
MLFSKGTTLSLLQALSISTSHVLAAPTSTIATRDTREPRLEDIRCRCLSFSMSAKPTLCTYLESYNLDWHTAYAFASDNDLKIQFASQDTVTKVLSGSNPLPTSMLMSIRGDEAGAESEYEAQSQQQSPMGLEETSANSVNKIVCGLGDEVNHLSVDLRFSEPELHYVGVVVACFMAFLVFWVVVEYLWTNYFTRNGAIKLEGEEKPLSTTSEHDAPTDFS